MIKTISILFSGLITGLFLQLALGPVFFYVLGITIDSNFTTSFFGILAVTLVDYIYIVLSLVGIGQLLRNKRARTIFGIASSVVLILFGVMFFHKGWFNIDTGSQISSIEWTPVSSFVSCFILTVSSPLTIVFWSSVFSAKAIEKNYNKNQLIVFGFGTGLSTFLFLSITMFILSHLKSAIPVLFVQILNCLVGLVLVLYGVTRTVKLIRT